ncbi:hypothetical protein D3C76_01840 [compost metagenome]
MKYDPRYAQLKCQCKHCCFFHERFKSNNLCSNCYKMIKKEFNAIPEKERGEMKLSEFIESKIVLAAMSKI